jgi:uncharacterized protein (DUF58 family)
MDLVKHRGVVRPEGPPRPAHKPGPGPVPAAALRALDLSVRRRVLGLAAGEHRAASLGLGTELAQVRPYEPGDDVRRIDWNVTARTRVPHVRVHVAERALDTWLVLDVSPSMVFGTADRRKADVAEGVAVAVSHLATRRGNRLGLVTFGDPKPATIPSRTGRLAHLGVLATFKKDVTEAEIGATDLEDAMRRAGRIARRRGLVVIVSDFRGPLGSHQSWRRPLLQLAGRHDVLAVEVRDPREMELPDVGDLTLSDPETGRQLRVDTASRRLRERFRAAAAAERAEVSAVFRKAGVRHLVLTTEGDWLRPLAALFRRGGRGGRTSAGVPA